MKRTLPVLAGVCRDAVGFYTREGSLANPTVRQHPHMIDAVAHLFAQGYEPVDRFEEITGLDPLYSKQYSGDTSNLVCTFAKPEDRAASCAKAPLVRKEGA